jgi:hypothetical protein
MKTENLHIAFGALGSALKFKSNTIKRFDGTLEYHKMLYMLVRNPSISKVTLVQKSDWADLNDVEKIEFDPRGVLFDVYSDDLEKFNRKMVKPLDMSNIQIHDNYKRLSEYLMTKEPIDAAYLFIGMAYYTNNSIPNFLASVRQGIFKDEFEKTGELHLCKIKWDTYNYSAPIVHWLNMSKTPWFMIATDPRYIKDKMRMRDTFNPPKEILSQYSESILWSSVDQYEGNFRKVDTETEKPVKLVATGIEKMTRINESIYTPDSERPVKMILGIMQSKYGDGAGYDERLEMLKEWIFKFDTNKEIEVYGKWAPDVITGYESWFKGMIHHEEIDAKLRTARYTLIKGIRSDWCTSKWADVLAQGTVPFLVPDYDTSFSIVTRDHFIRVSTPRDLYEKMNYLDANPDKRIQLVKGLQYKLLRDAKTGVFVYDILNNSYERVGLQLKLDTTIDTTIKRKTKVKSLF